MISLACAFLPLIGSLLLVIPAFRGRAALGVVFGVSLLETLTAFAAVAVRVPEAPEYSLERFMVLDATSALFLLLISVVFLGISIYFLNQPTGVALPVPGPDRHLAMRSLLFFSCSIFAVLSNHLVSMWIFLELGTFAIAPLICQDNRPAGLRASWKYLLFSVIGLGFNFLGLLCLARAMGGSHGHHELTFFIDDLNQVTTLGDPLWWRLGMALIVFGLGTKLGLAPMYAWLPDAYDEAPAAITTMMTAVQSNCVILALFRQVGLLRSFDPGLISEELIMMGAVSIGVAGLHIIRADNFKRLICYASINHAGTIALGLGSGKYAAYGVVLYVVSNALVKSVLFLTGGNIENHYGTKRIFALRGLMRVMPFSAPAFMLGVFALLGFAPFGSFLGEVMMLSNMIEEGHLLGFFFVCIMLTIILMATGRALFPMIWGDAPEGGTPARDPFSSNVACLFFVVILVSLGIYMPSPVSSLLREVATTLGGR